ncbi:hypothetical protein [Leptospira weilii]|uniref:hypothetical protein n=1 Tax=Leptospira weilii TaxID=28184 RepID=UPI0012BAD092|nr:hypothetical protein [Leptospira weilii]
MNRKETGVVWSWFGLIFSNPISYPTYDSAVLYASFRLAPAVMGSAIYSYPTEIIEVTTRKEEKETESKISKK